MQSIDLILVSIMTAFCVPIVLLAFSSYTLYNSIAMASYARRKNEAMFRAVVFGRALTKAGRVKSKDVNLPTSVKDSGRPSRDPNQAKSKSKSPSPSPSPGRTLSPNTNTTATTSPTRSASPTSKPITRSPDCSPPNRGQLKQVVQAMKRSPNQNPVIKKKLAEQSPRASKKSTELNQLMNRSNIRHLTPPTTKSPSPRLKNNPPKSPAIINTIASIKSFASPTPSNQSSNQLDHLL